MGRQDEMHPAEAVDTKLTYDDYLHLPPDILYVSNECAGLGQDGLRVAPDLAIEILSPSSRRTDEVAKRKLFERVGVREYWIVDPELDVVKIYRREGGRFVRTAELSREEGHVVETPLFPGLHIALDELFR